MLLVENTEPCVRTVDNIILIPGINRVDEESWERVQPLFGKPIDELVEQGVFKIQEAEKPSVAIIKKTYSVKLLQEWLEDAGRGPQRKALLEQLKLMGFDESGNVIAPSKTSKREETVDG
jgi:hypothetical protein